MSRKSKSRKPRESRQDIAQERRCAENEPVALTAAGRLALEAFREGAEKPPAPESDRPQ